MYRLKDKSLTISNIHMLHRKVTPCTALKVTQNNNKDVWANVPIQNFTAISDIDWNQSIADIDKQLYRKYKLDEDESDFIEKMVKPMD